MLVSEMEGPNPISRAIVSVIKQQRIICQYNIYARGIYFSVELSSVPYKLTGNFLLSPMTAVGDPWRTSSLSLPQSCPNMSYPLGLALGTGTDKTESIFFSFLLEGCKRRTFDFFCPLVSLWVYDSLLSGSRK